MAITIEDGPSFCYGAMGPVPLSIGGNTAVGDPNQDAGPSAEYQGDGILDVRYIFLKDQLQGYTGKQPVHFSMPYLRSVGQIPAAFAAANIAAAANVVNGTAMTLVAANATGITVNVPIIPYSVGGINNLALGANVVTTALALDFGFAFGNVTSGNPLITVANTFDFAVGMPLVLAGVGAAGGTTPLLTTVAQINSNTTLTLNDTPKATANPVAIGTGNIWGPSPVLSSLANATPTAALPWLGAGPGLFLDPRQTIARAVSITGSASATGGTFTVRGYDIYHQPITNTITVGAGAVIGFGTKAFKYIVSVTPNFTDAHNYSVGTSDMYGLHYRSSAWDDVDVSWAGAFQSSSVGYIAPLSLLTTSTATTADVRGLIQTTTANGSGTGIGTTASNGTVSGLAMSGNRLTMSQTIIVPQAVMTSPAAFTPLYGQAQF